MLPFCDNCQVNSAILPQSSPTCRSLPLPAEVDDLARQGHDENDEKARLKTPKFYEFSTYRNPHGKGRCYACAYSRT